MLFALVLAGCNDQTSSQNSENKEVPTTSREKAEVKVQSAEDSQPEESLLKNELVNVYFFWGDGCPHCTHEKPFLEKMAEKYPDIEVYDYEVWKIAENRELMQEFGEKLDATVNGVPFTVIGEEYVVGWMDEKTTGEQIESAINKCLKETCRDIGKEIENQ